MTRREKRKEELQARLQVISPILVELACHRECIGNCMGNYRERIESQYRELLDEAKEIKRLLYMGWGVSQ